MWFNCDCVEIVALSSLLFVLTVASDCGCSGKLSRSSSDSLLKNSIDETCPVNTGAKTEKYTHNMALIEPGEYEIGTDNPVFVTDGEAPARTVYLDEFYMDLYEVSNQDFADFVKFRNYTTEAEKAIVLPAPVETAESYL